MDVERSYINTKKMPLLKAFIRSEFSIEPLEPRILLDAAAAAVTADAVETAPDPSAAEASSANTAEADAQAQADANTNLADQIENVAAPVPVANSTTEQTAPSDQTNSQTQEMDSNQINSYDEETHFSEFVVGTNKDDYMPGETAFFTIDGLTPGATIKIQVFHITDPGTDGIYGTLDDVLDQGPDGKSNTADDGYGETGEGHEPFIVTDGKYEIISAGPDGIEGTADDVITGDLDKTENGTIVTSWYVNPDDSLGATFLLTASEVNTSDNAPNNLSASEMDAADTVSTNQIASTSFTDAFPNPVETYYVPLPESDINNSFEIINPITDRDIETRIGITIASAGTIILYDHWEDGYETDVTTPAQSTTEVWGDQNLANGAAPGVTNAIDDVFIGGEAIVLANAVPVTHATNPGSNIFYDGSDRIQASLPIAVTRAAYPQDPGSLLAGGVEVLNVNALGDDYTMPVGENTPDNSGTDPFDYTAAYVMATEDNTPNLCKWCFKYKFDKRWR